MMTRLADQQLQELIDSGESTRVEFKEHLNESTAKSIRKDICALANDLPNHQAPGFIFVGIKDNGTASGITVDDLMLRNLAGMKTDGNLVPPPSINVEKRNLAGGEVAVIAVEVSDSPPVRFQGCIYVRSGPRRDIATAQDERILNEKRRHGDRPFDIQPIPGTGPSDLDLLTFGNSYLTRAFSAEVLETNNRSLEEQLAATKMVLVADEPRATVLGILILGRHPQDYLPGALVQFLRFDGNSHTDEIIDEAALAGTIPDQLRRLEEKLETHNRTSVDITSGSLERRTHSYPLEALHQLTRNAVMHRSYEDTNAPVHVHWFNDRIEITNPGGPYGFVTREQFGQSGQVDYRNPNLAEALKTLGFVQRFGVGIRIARERLEKAGHPEPVFEIHGNFVQVTIKSITES